jgi:hypothetical protein
LFRAGLAVEKATNLKEGAGLPLGGRGIKTNLKEGRRKSREGFRFLFPFPFPFPFPPEKEKEKEKEKGVFRPPFGKKQPT